MLKRWARSRILRTSSCKSSALLKSLRTASWAHVLSSSINTVRPLNRSPYTSSARRLPRSSRKLIGRLRSALVNTRRVSSRWPSSQTSSPQAKSLASEPTTARSPAGGVHRGEQLALRSALDHHTRSLQKPSLRAIGPLVSLWTLRTVPLIQSTRRPTNCRSMACM